MSEQEKYERGQAIAIQSNEKLMAENAAFNTMIAIAEQQVKAGNWSDETRYYFEEFGKTWATTFAERVGEQAKTIYQTQYN